MKLSELTTDQALDALCELTPHVANIVSDEAILSTAGKVPENIGALNLIGKTMIVAERLTELTPMLLKTHRVDVYGILSVINKKTVEEVANQPLVETMRQVQELTQDEELMSFFKSSARREQTEPSALSVASPVSG